MMEDNTYKIRKDKIKTIAIIFLSVLLVLTFFSNSILNRSLPEVATQYVESGSITEKIRGTGAVVANDPYQVMAKDGRVIQSVAVKNGDTVEKGQVLFYLEETESEELDEALLAYTQELLSGDISNEAYLNIQSGNISSIAQYQAKIEAARQNVENAENTVTSLTAQIEALEGSTSQADLQAKIEQAETQLASAKTAVETEKGKVDTISGKIAAIPSNIAELVASAVLSEELAKAEYDTAMSALLNAINVNADPDITAEEFAALSMADIAALATEHGALTELATMQEKYDVYVEKKATRESLAKQQASVAELKKQLEEAKKKYNSAVKYCNDCQTYYDSLSSSASQTGVSNQEKLASLKTQLSDAEKVLEEAKTAQTQLLTDISKELDLSDKKEDIEKLQKESENNSIVAPVAGVVSGITLVAGDTTTADEAVATVQASGKGFTLSFPVTNAQAAKVKVGDAAEVQNSWYYEDVNAILTKIKPDADNPGKNKILEFAIEGTVQEGENLNLSVGESSGNYDVIVPNSAIREDRNGKFILIIKEKRTPFGTRYIAQREGVEVIVSDETKSAVLSELEGYEYVITTSNKPVEAGTQVRLADN